MYVKLNVIKNMILLFQPTCTNDIVVLAGELNRCSSMPEGLRCGEYEFKLKMNPWQHPIYEENIHILLALLTSLRHGCGGVVYLMTEDTENVAQDIFNVYQGRLLPLISRKLESQTDMVRVSFRFGTHLAWAALLLKKAYDALKYLAAEIKVT